LYRSDLYDVRLFGNAQSFISGYLGDVLLNAFVVLFLAASLHILIKTDNKKWFVWNTLIVSTFIFFIVFQFNHIAVSLVTNSTLSFDLLSIFDIKYAAIIGLAALCLYAPALFAATNILISLIQKNNKLPFLLFLLINVSICALLAFVSHSPDL